MAIIYRHWFPCTITPENPHGKGYVGYTYKTIEKRDQQRFAPSSVNDSVALKSAIAKYGKKNMETDVIDNILPIHDLVTEREKYWIARFDDYYNGYNCTEGGDGFSCGENNPMYGKEHSQETRQKISQSMTGKYSGKKNPMYGKTGEKNPLYRVKRPEHSEKMSGGNNPCYGRTGKKNPMYGRTSENHPATRPEYMQVKWDFFLLYPSGMDIKKIRKHLYKKFDFIDYRTIWSWTRKWQSELEDSTQ